MENKFRKQNAYLVKTLAESITGAIPGTAPNTFGTSTAQMTALSTASGNLANGIVSVDAAKTQLASAMQERESARLATVDAIASIANTIYGNPSVTPMMIALTGLAPRATTQSKTVPTTPITLVTTPFANGEVKLKWGRNGNKASVVFSVEAKTGDGPWAIVGLTTKSSISFEGYAPGTLVWFRVKATANGLFSAPSNSSAIYGPDSSESLDLKVA